MNFCDTPIALRRCAIVGVYMLGFGIPWSSAIFRLSFPLIFLSALWAAFIAFKWDGSIRSDIKSIVMESSSLFILSFVVWVISSVLWTDATMSYYKFDVSQYLKLLLIPVLAILIRNILNDKGTDLIGVYLVGVFVLMLPSALDGIGVFKYFDIDANRYRNAAYREGSFSYFRNHIVHGFHVGALAAIVLLRAIMFVGGRGVALAILIYTIFDILFWTSGRMALVGLFVGLVFSIFISNVNSNKLSIRQMERKKIIIFSIAILFVLLSFGLDGIQERYQSVIDEVKQFVEQSYSNTSAGIRIHFWLVSLGMFFDSWFLGAGAGSFRHTLEVSKDVYFGTGYSHAHNEYLTILSQFGLVGFILFLGIFYTLITKALSHQDPWIGRGFLCLLVVFSVNALSDSSLYNQWEGWTLVYFSAIMLGTRRVV